MLVVNYSTIREQLKNYCDKVTGEHETVIITRKGEENVVLINLRSGTLCKKRSKMLNILPKLTELLNNCLTVKGNFSFTKCYNINERS